MYVNVHTYSPNSLLTLNHCSYSYLSSLSFSCLLCILFLCSLSHLLPSFSSFVLPLSSSSSSSSSSHSVIMERPYWKHEQLFNETLSVSFEDVVTHAEQLFSNASVICFAHGNIAEEQVTPTTSALHIHVVRI